MIKILDADLKRLAILQNVETCSRFEEINGENKLDFTGLYEGKIAQYVDEDTTVELDGDYFDVAYYNKQQLDSGVLDMQVQTEHVSYRLNDEDYNLDMFAATGTPEEVLEQILDDTPFTVGTVEYEDEVTYSAQEAKSRRQILMEFVALVGGEVDFNKFTVSIVAHRGSTAKKLLAKGKNIKVVSRIYDKRQKDKDGNPLISYTCTPIQVDTPFALGDEVLLIQKDLGIQTSLRIVRLGYNPYLPIEASIELANFVPSLADDAYRIETTKVTADKVYNGAKIGPEEGVVVTRSDNKIKTVLNATEGISINKDNEGTWVKMFFVDLDGNVIAEGIVTAHHGLNVSSNVWNAGTDHGIIFGGVLPGYSGPATIKYTQGLTGDGTSALEITALQINLNGISSVEGDLIATKDYVDGKMEYHIAHYHSS